MLLACFRSSFRFFMSRSLSFKLNVFNCHINLHVLYEWMNIRTKSQKHWNEYMCNQKIATCTHIYAFGVYASSINKLEGALRHRMYSSCCCLSFCSFPLLHFHRLCVFWLYVIFCCCHCQLSKASNHTFLFVYSRDSFLSSFWMKCRK